MKDMCGRGRICYIIESASEYLISILITGAYLAKLTSKLGFSDSLTAILSSFVALGCSFQIFSIAFFKNGSVKRKVTILHILNQLLFMGLYVVPFVKIGSEIKTAVFIFLILGGYFLSNVIFAPKTNWFVSYVADNKRGVFTSVKEAVSLISGIAFQIIMGRVIDGFERAGNNEGAFLVCGITIFILMVIHTLTLILPSENETIQRRSTSGIRDFKMIIKDKSIMFVILASILWSVISHVSIPFYGTYQIKELGFSMTFVAALSFVYSAVRIPCSFVLGRYADKNSFVKMLKICYFLAATAFFAATFTRPSNGYIMYPVYYVLYAAAMGGINSAETNLIFDYVREDKRSNALAVKQTISGLFGFLTTIIATPILNYVQGMGNKLFGITMYAQQLLSFIAFAGTIFLIVYMDKIVSKIKTPFV